MFYVYILRSRQNKSYYIGHTDNFVRRIAEHNSGKNISTKAKAPWDLVRKEFFNTRAEAMKREREIKNKKRKSYIEWLINQVD